MLLVYSPLNYNVIALIFTSHLTDTDYLPFNHLITKFDQNYKIRKLLFQIQKQAGCAMIQPIFYRKLFGSEQQLDFSPNSKIIVNFRQGGLLNVVTE